MIKTVDRTVNIECIYLCTFSSLFSVKNEYDQKQMGVEVTPIFVNNSSC